MKTQINNQTNIQQQWLPHESLLVYDMALKFHIGAMTLLPKRGYPNLRDQLERASLSIVLNIAEGAGRKSAADRARPPIYRTPRGVLPIALRFACALGAGAPPLALLAGRGHDLI